MSKYIPLITSGITGYKHDDETRGSILGATGRPDDGSVLDAIGLNNLEDWNDFWASEMVD